MPAAEFLTLRLACGLTQTECAAYLDVSLVTVQRWEAGTRSVPGAARDKIRELDDLIRGEVSKVLAPLVDTNRKTVMITLYRYRSEEDFAASRHADSGLSLAAHHATLPRIIDGLSRLGIEYTVIWAGD